MADGKRVLVYELHITNFGSTAFELKRIEIFGAGGQSPLQDLNGEELKKCLRPLGEAADPAKIDVGRRVIFGLEGATAASYFCSQSHCRLNCRPR